MKRAATPHDHAIDARHVHKADPRGVLVTTARAAAAGPAGPLEVGDVWYVGARLPLAAPSGDVFAHTDALVIAIEALRQAGIAHAHLAGDVPLGHRFVASHIGLAWHSDPALLGSQVVEGTFALRTETVRHQRGALTRHSFSATLLHQGQVLATGSGSLQVVDGRVYERLRAGATPWADVSEHHDPAYLLGATTTDMRLAARLGWTASDPITFDHGNDHIPAMHLARTALAAHRALDADAAPTGLLLRCASFVELAGDVDVVAERSGQGDVVTTFRQGGAPAATVQTIVRPQGGTAETDRVATPAGAGRE
ncbi:MAG: hypothetical protein FWF90_16725 [Promicromonosporaceae bacterium]|nr:hypothetical protein [Promicromonosporaceae bacterium]